MQNNFDSIAKEWFPHRIIRGEDPIALLVLNQPLSEENKEYLISSWDSALFRVAVDGGANQLKNLCNDNLELVPDLVCGDFDSALPGILSYYEKKGVDVIPTPDQDETDFMKAVRLTVKRISDKCLKVTTILAVSRHGDRLDHMLGNLNTLYMSYEITDVPVLILGECSLTWLLLPGSHKIHIASNMSDSHVGLIPLGKECNNVTTTGLKWNLTQDKMAFGGLISTCNMFDSDIVTISTDSPLIWTMEVKMK